MKNLTSVHVTQNGKKFLERFFKLLLSTTIENVANPDIFKTNKGRN
jgi:hypothetical protein